MRNFVVLVVLAVSVSFAACSGEQEKKVLFKNLTTEHQAQLVSRFAVSAIQGNKVDQEQCDRLCQEKVVDYLLFDKMLVPAQSVWLGMDDQSIMWEVIGGRISSKADQLGDFRFGDAIRLQMQIESARKKK